MLILRSGADRFVHTSTAANSTQNWTLIDHPLTNNRPDAMLVVTPRCGSSCIWAPHPVGVWYSGNDQKWSIFNEDIADMSTGRGFSVHVVTTKPSAFVHGATGGNTTGHVTYIDDPRTNGKPNAIVFVTPNWNPGGLGGTYNTHPIGVWYSTSAKKWSVFNQDFGSMLQGADFNVFVATNERAAFVHTTEAANMVENFTLIDHRLTNGNPNAIVLVTANRSPGGYPGPVHPHQLGVWYDAAAKKWSIFNQDIYPMRIDDSFNVLIPSVDTSVFVHIARAGNTGDNYTLIDHPLTNGRPNSVLLVTSNWNPSGIGYTYLDHPIGVWYSGGQQKWSIFNQDLAPMPEGAAFNVLVAASDDLAFVHTATGSSVTGPYTRIDHRLTNRRNSAILLITPNWNPGGGSGIYNNHVTAVWYHSDRRQWAVYNQSAVNMPAGAAFNVLVAGFRGYLPVLRR